MVRFAGMHDIAALAFSVTVTLALAFQLALAAGAPWGAYAMGGRHPGRFPTPLRIAAVVQAALLAALGGVVLARADLALPNWSAAADWLIWVVVAFSTLSLALNLLTPSAVERRLWAPVALVLLTSSVFVAIGPR